MPKRHSYKAASVGRMPEWPFDTSALGVTPQEATAVLAIVKRAADAIRAMAPSGDARKRGGLCGGLAVRVFAGSLEHVAERWADKVVDENGEAAAQLREMGGRH